MKLPRHRMSRLAMGGAGLSFLFGLGLGLAGCGDIPDEGATPSATALTAPIPLKHVVVVIKENHTFDNYFGSFPGAEGTLDPAGRNVCPTPSGAVGHARARPTYRSTISATSTRARSPTGMAVAWTGGTWPAAATQGTGSRMPSTARPTSPTT